MGRKRGGREGRSTDYVSIVLSIGYDNKGSFWWILTERHRWSSERVEKRLFSCRDTVNAHVWAEGPGDEDRAIGLLKILNNCNPRTAHGESRTVERVHKVAFAAALWLASDARTARLEGLAVRARRNFAEFVAGGQPNLDVVGFRGSET